MICGPGLYLPAPDKTDLCCWESIDSNGKECSCWEPIVWPEPTRKLQRGPAAIRPSMCGDCAYRPGSPERAAEGGEQLDAAPWDPFHCHDGMPKVVGFTHPKVPDVSFLAYWVGDRDDYKPLQAGGRAWKADGSPAVLCGGWGAVAGMSRR